MRGAAGAAAIGVRTLACVLAVLAVAAAPPGSAQPIYSCPQAGAPPRYQDRPCAATPVAPARERNADVPARAPAQSAEFAAAGASAPSDRADVRATAPSAATATAPASAASLPLDRAATRGEYVARNAERCAAGDRRACAAVTCEQSGGLGTKQCQAALGYRRGPGWDLRPASDVFDAARRDDEYSLRCTQQPQRARVIVPRGGAAARVLAGTAEPTTLPLEAIAEYAARYCRAR